MKQLTLASVLLSSVLFAGMGYNMPSFSDFDTNDDGKVTQEEFENTQNSRMTKRANEGKMMRNAGNAPSFSDIDTDNNGHIDKNEFKKHQQGNK
jgi:Ca2+-binding EF-hand superfamily protein